MGTGLRDRVGGDENRDRGSLGEIPPTTVYMLQISAEVGDGKAREGGEVPGGLHTGVQFPYILERGRLRPETW